MAKPTAAYWVEEVIERGQRFYEVVGQNREMEKPVAIFYPFVNSNDAWRKTKEYAEAPGCYTVYTTLPHWCKPGDNRTDRSAWVRYKREN